MQGSRDLEAVEVASLTKIMTLYLSLHLYSKLRLSKDTLVTVSECAAGTIGTTANLKTKDKIRLCDLMYGLMLPSGNDAATALAEYFGRTLPGNHPLANFIAEMNRAAKHLGLLNTVYCNPHGLMQKRNLSSARDTCKLASVAMGKNQFRKIVNTQQYSATIISENGTERVVHWANTNKLLSLGFDGVKTGVTVNAGPCLCISKGTENGHRIVVTILNCKSMDARWGEVRKLTDWGNKVLLG